MNTYEWRACVREAGGLADDWDWEGPFNTREEAEDVLPQLMAIAAVYDKGWVERRLKTEWERDPDEWVYTEEKP